jgi:hypothetical protein
MALALNVFKTITAIASSTSVGIYTASTGYSGVILLAQAANVSSSTYNVTFSHQRTASGIAVTTQIVPNMPIPGNDVLPLLTGRLVAQTGDTLLVSTNDTSNSNVKIVISVLETLN